MSKNHQNNAYSLVDEHTTTYENPFKFSAKELDDITGLYDHGARSRNPMSTLWYGVDPLWEQYPDFSPYNYCAGNPVKLVDLNGRKVTIKGDSEEEINKAFNQLQSSTNLNLSIKDGVLDAEGTPKTEADKLLYRAIKSIKDENGLIINVILNVNVTNIKDGKWFVGGCFGGNTKEGDIVTAEQTVNPNVTQKMDEWIQKGYGITILHELLEAYIGGRDHPNTNSTSFDNMSSENYQNYLDAHNKAISSDSRYKDPGSHISAEQKGKQKVILWKFEYYPFPEYEKVNTPYIIYQEQ